MSPLVRSLPALAALLAAVAYSTTAQAAHNHTRIVIGNISESAIPLYPPIHIHVDPPGGDVHFPDLCFEFGPFYRLVGVDIEGRADVPGAKIIIVRKSPLDLYVDSPAGAELYITEFCSLFH